MLLCLHALKCSSFICSYTEIYCIAKEFSIRCPTDRHASSLYYQAFKCIICIVVLIVIIVIVAITGIIVGVVSSQNRL